MAIHLTADEVVGPLTEKQAELMAAARQDCERLQGIVDDLLDLSRIQSGRMALKLERLDAAAMLQGAAAAVRPAAEADGLVLAVAEVDPALEVRADTERAQLVLTNLLANAVRDTGEGIAREHQERIFDKFYRVPGARGGGVGLGLYISREIVQAHGGAMGVESVSGKGSTFWFTLPVAEPRTSAV